MLIIVLLILFFVGLYLYITRNNNYWKNRGVPYEQPVFYFGNLKDVFSGKKHFGTLYIDLYKKFRTYPYSGYLKLTEPSVVLHDLDLIKNVLIRDFQHFANNSFQIDFEIDPTWGSNAFMQVGERWKTTRNAWTLSLTPARLKALYDNNSKTASSMVEFLRKHDQNNPKEPHDLRMITAKFFTDAIVRSVFEQDINSFENPLNPYLKISQSIFTPNFCEGIKVMLFFIAPGLTKLLRIPFIQKSILKELLQLAKVLIQQRKEKGLNKMNPFDSMVLSKGAAITENEAAGIVFSFILDGTETSSGVGSFLLYSLAANLDVQNKLQREIDDAYEKNGGKIDFQTIHDLPYLDMVINETMRLYPPLLNLERSCTVDYELPPIEGSKPVKISKGMTVVVPVLGLQMDPVHFPDPEKFDPERFNDENKPKIPKYSYLPFGDGQRMCLGARFAINQLKIFVTNLMRNFDVRLAPEMIGKSIELDPEVFLYRSKNNLMGMLHSRKHE